MQFIEHQPGDVIPLSASGNLVSPAHILEADSINAVNAAIAAQRPLLVRGEPGVGKSQLARAVAIALNWAFIPFVMDARTESRDLLWHFDAIERLAEAQLQGALGGSKADIRTAMAVEKFISPGPLWWAFNWAKADTQAQHLKHSPPPQPDGGDHTAGCVVLIDEIDKAETDVPNGLLEALGQCSFTPQGLDQPVTVSDNAPLVIIATNEERALPDAFIRRCVVLHLHTPDVQTEREKFVNYLVQRGQAHFPNMHASELNTAANLVAQDRSQALDHSLTPLPGVAEYLDLLRAMAHLPEDGTFAERLRQVAAFTVRKHPELQQKTSA